MVWLLGAGFILAVLLLTGLFVIDRKSIKSVNKAKEDSRNDEKGSAATLPLEDTDNLLRRIEQYIREDNPNAIDRIVDQMELFPHEKQRLIRQTLRQPAVLDRYKAGLADADYKTRAASADRLGKIGGAGVSVGLFQAMADKKEEVRMAAASALKKLKDPSVAGLLIDALRFPNKWLPARVAEVLVSLGEVSVTALQGAMQDDDPVIRAYVVELLGEVGEPVPVSTIYPALRDEHSNVRLQAARVLGKMGKADAVEHLAELFDDPEEKVRIQAVRSVGKIGGKAALMHMEKLLQQNEPVIRLAAFESLKLMGSEGIDIIQTIHSTPGHALAEQAADFLKSNGIKQSAKVNITFN